MRPRSGGVCAVAGWHVDLRTTAAGVRRVLHATTGEILAHSPSTHNTATTAPANLSAAHHAPTDPEKARNPNPHEGSGLADVSRHHRVGLTGFEPATPCPPDKCANQAALQPAIADDRSGS